MLHILSDLRKIVPRDEKKNILLILLLIASATCLETLSVGLIIPGLALFSGDANALLDRLPGTVLNNIRSRSREDLLVIGMFLLVIIFFLKNSFIAFSNWFQARFASILQMKLARQLFATYLRQPYSFHLNRNSSELIRYVNNETHSVINYVIAPLLVMTSECFVIFGLVVLLIMLEPFAVAVSLGFLALAAGFLHYLIKNKLRKWGQMRMKYEVSVLQHLQQGLGGVKDIKLLGRETEFLLKFESNLRGAATMYGHSRAVAELPRLWLEFFGVFGLCLMVFILNRLLGKNIGSMLTLAGVCAVAAFRVLPSLNRIAFAIQAMSYGRSVVAKLAAEFALPSDPVVLFSKQSRPLVSALEVKDVNFYYENSDQQVLNSVSLTIIRGQTVGIIGPSGSGKSTLVDIILGLLSPTSGQVLVDSSSIYEDIRNWQSQIGYVPQVIFLTDDSLRRNIAFGLSDEEIDNDKVETALHAAMLTSFVKSLPDGLDTLVGDRGVKLSGGQRQRIGIARALYNSPEVLVFDEATSALDGETEQGVMDSLASLKGKKTLIIVAHRLSTVQDCDIIYKLDKGHVTASGSYQNVIGASLGARRHHDGNVNVAGKAELPLK
jgi:ABC-type multidrug transport system fused ATPase/permease subunit